MDSHNFSYLERPNTYTVSFGPCPAYWCCNICHPILHTSIISRSCAKQMNMYKSANEVEAGNVPGESQNLLNPRRVLHPVHSGAKGYP